MDGTTLGEFGRGIWDVVLISHGSPGAKEVWLHLSSFFFIFFYFHFYLLFVFDMGFGIMNLQPKRKELKKWEYWSLWFLSFVPNLLFFLFLFLHFLVWGGEICFLEI